MGKNNFIVDVDTGSLVGDFSKISAASAPSFTFGDKREISVSLVKRNSSASSQPWRYVSLEGKTARVALGSQGKTPTDGVFTLSFDGDETSELAAYSTATEVSDALNLLASVIFAGGVSVVAISSHAFRITFNLADGARSAITANTETLQPSSSAFVGDSVEGDGTTKAVQVIFIEVAPSAYVELTDSIANPSLTISTDRAGVVGVTAERKSVAIEGAPHAGTYTLTIDAQTSAAINFNSTVAEIQETLEALPTIGAGKVLVIGDSNDYAIEFSKSLGNVGVMTSDASNLYGALGKTGELNLNVTGLVELLKGYTQASATLEIEIVTTATSASDTVHQSLVSVIQDVIPSTPPVITPFPDYSIVGHTHAISDVTGLQDALDASAAHEADTTTNPHAVTAAQVGAAAEDDVVDLTTAQTIAGDKTFTGQQQATGQAAVDGDSLMTLGLTEDRHGSGFIPRSMTNVVELPFTAYTPQEFDATPTATRGRLVSGGACVVLPSGLYVPDLAVAEVSDRRFKIKAAATPYALGWDIDGNFRQFDDVSMICDFLLFGRTTSNDVCQNYISFGVAFIDSGAAQYGLRIFTDDQTSSTITIESYTNTGDTNLYTESNRTVHTSTTSTNNFSYFSAKIERVGTTATVTLYDGAGVSIFTYTFSSILSSNCIPFIKVENNPNASTLGTSAIGIQKTALSFQTIN